MKANWVKKTLYFKQPAGTSRGVMKTRDVWYITLSQDGKSGIGECAPLPGLSLDFMDPTLILPYDSGENQKDLLDQNSSPCHRGNTRGSEKWSNGSFETALGKVCQKPEYFINDFSQLADFPSIRFGLELAHLDLINGGGQHYFSEFDSININGLIWMGNEDFMVRQVEEKLADGWQCIKVKIGAIDFDKELSILRSIRKRFSRDALELRVDANGAFTKNDVHEKLDQLASLDLHSIEQPIQQGQWDLLSELCQTSSVPIALDEELIPLVREKNRIEMLDKVNPQFVVLKPSLLGGFTESEKWIQLAKERNIGWWVTSALESSIGLNAISQWTAKLNPDGFQGLGTGQLFVNNLPSPLKVNQGVLSLDKSPIWKDVNQFISEWLIGSEEMTLQTSGSTGKPKSIQVKKEWMKNSAQLTGKTFGIKEGDSALLCMPMKYVAGKMMVVRALELGLNLNVIEPSSSPLEGLDGTIDFAAIVPLQLENSLHHLDKVKTLIVGGGQVHSALVEKLQSIKTEVFETYGMTETLTHVAIKLLNGRDKSDLFHTLDGIRFEMDERGCLVIHAPILNPEPVVTNDLVELVNDASFKWLGRFDNIINSGGVKIIPEVVEAKLAEIIKDHRYFIAGLPDESLGEKVVLIVEGDGMEIPFDKLDKYERPREIYFISKFVNTDSGKLNREETIRNLKSKSV